METSSEELAAFLHDDAHYLTEWRNIKEFDISSFNYSAFFFGILWMLYRKMYMPAEKYYAKLHQKGGKSWISVVVVGLLLVGDYIYENRNGEVKASRQIHGPIGITPIWQTY
ncbi:DUF2628 domain-containing protein [Adhaeribacter radiodurans]|uniref:DUF2628 domain-containing protein n=1 Tax=Adhaeribacter radiodurans TaxID=2745197 RepID=A0A7L7L4D7_9BACT|nr:DUF2628 domain-containing protein [Adhaeribacter radiodurans]QMU27640.1 DUF2628 domain-containing protein [Adhaeribacter radiodurans]